MSIASTISNAMSGLTATARAAEVVSNNVANVMTDGYARRELELSTRTIGSSGGSAGVSVDGIKRIVDEAILRDRQLADSAAGNASVRADFYESLEQLIGTPEDASSLDARVAALEKSFVEAAGRPDSDARLAAIVDAGIGIVNQFDKVSDGVQQLRMDADARIATEVHTLNASMKQVADLNIKISQAQSQRRDTSALMDMRQQEIDKIANIVPLRVVQRDNGHVGLFTTNGAQLVDGTASVIGFDAHHTITPEMTIGGGTLSGLTINGRPMPITGDTSQILGGSLGALFEVRDELAVNAQTKLDAMARDLMERFEDPAVDPTLTGPGLFTDLGSMLDVSAEVGLAGRLSLNTVVDPDKGGDLWRLRDGLEAAAPSDVGNGSLLQSMADAVKERRSPASGDLPPNQSMSGLTSFLLSETGVARQNSEMVLAGSLGQQLALTQMQRADGVDTDAEMQRLMLIEQAYAANARVISVADQLIRRLLEM